MFYETLILVLLILFISTMMLTIETIAFSKHSYIKKLLIVSFSIIVMLITEVYIIYFCLTCLLNLIQIKI